MTFDTYKDRAAKREKIEEVIKNFQEASRQYFGSHSYAAGYLGSALIILMLDHMTEDQIARDLRHMMESTIQFQKEALLKKSA